MIIKSKQTTKMPVPEGAIWDYPMPNDDVGIAYQSLNGRCPKVGRYLNNVCQEMYFIISGTADFYIENKKYSIKPHDVFIVEPKTLHYFIAKNLKFITITKPNWYIEQYENIK